MDGKERRTSSQKLTWDGGICGRRRRLLPGDDPFGCGFRPARPALQHLFHLVNLRYQFILLPRCVVFGLQNGHDGMQPRQQIDIPVLTGKLHQRSRGAAYACLMALNGVLVSTFLMIS